MSHPHSSRVQHFGVSGEMHLHAAVLVERHRQLLQSFVSTVRTKHFVHVTGRPGLENTSRLKHKPAIGQFVFKSLTVSVVFYRL